MNRRSAFQPVEGWLTLGLVGLMCITMALALDDARWVLGRDQYLDSLMYLAIGGVLVGFIGPKVGWGRWTTYLIGSIFAALIVPILVARVAFPNGASIHDLYDATAGSVVTAYMDIAVRNLPTTSQYLHHILIFALLVWATSMFASYAVFGHRRPLSAVVVVGVILVGNMGVTANDELPLLITFSVASLLLLIRSHVFDEQSEWLRRRIGDPSTISSIYLRGGTMFIVVAVGASVLLTQTASSKPLAGAWDGLEEGLIGVSQAVSRFLPTGGSSRAIGLAFGPNAQIGQVWTTDQSLAVTIQRNPTDNGKYYWRAYTYDKIGLQGWDTSARTSVPIAPDVRVLDGTADDVAAQGRHSFTFTVNPVQFHTSTILSPGTPIDVDKATQLTTVGTDGYFATLDRDGSGSYTVTALTEVRATGLGQENVAALKATGRDYPAEIKQLYLGVEPGQIGPNAQKLEDTIVAKAGSDDPIDLADALVNELRSPTYTYSTDITQYDCTALSKVECFATIKTGFCQYYAATMAVILRDLKVPTRIVQGFLPGSRDANTATEQVPFSNAHAWVEVYFPTYGWVTFDPTSSNVSQIGLLPAGSADPNVTPRPLSSGPLPTIPHPASRDPLINRPAIGTLGGPGSLGPLVAVLVLLLLIVGGVAFITWQRGPRGGTSADGAYGTVTRIASRFGFGPRPAQTVYEYASSLGDVLPTVRPELETVAQAKVESIYARQVLGQERLDSLRAAQRRLRVGLLRLALRRKQRPRRRR
ncbi:MAG TPA: transglutaminase domain-containing protein [Candidatus Limnocylindrales bacterium]|jgi:transglutaminase-like putative cysteine protease